MTYHGTICLVRIILSTHHMMATLFAVLFSLFCAAEAFSPPPLRVPHFNAASRITTLSAAATSVAPSATTSAESTAIVDLKAQILASIEPTKRGLSTTEEQRGTIEAQIRSLEAACPLDEPARDPRMAGGWEVLYTTAPPPSNGKLGPFVGVAKQAIDLQSGGYKNILQVGSEDNVWLSAVLDASWEEWNGELLEEKSKGGGEKWRAAVVNAAKVSSGEETTDSSDGNDANGTSPSSPWDGLMSMFGGKTGDKSKKTADFGATSWKVDFKTITISIFGIPLLKNTFPENTARVWKTTCEYYTVFAISILERTFLVSFLMNLYACIRKLQSRANAVFLSYLE